MSIYSYENKYFFRAAGVNGTEVAHHINTPISSVFALQGMIIENWMEFVAHKYL